MAATVSDYTTTAKVTKWLSALGVSLRQDDDSTRLAEFITIASEEVYQYCGLRYTDDELADSPWVSTRTTIFCGYLYCGSRANPVPKTVEKWQEENIKLLERVQSGMRIAGIVARKEEVPVLTSQGVALRPFPRVVSNPTQSTGTPEGYTQHRDSRDLLNPGDFNGNS
jgi:hypothetical protein